MKKSPKIPKSSTSFGFVMIYEVIIVYFTFTFKSINEMEMNGNEKIPKNPLSIHDIKLRFKSSKS